MATKPPTSHPKQPVILNHHRFFATASTAKNVFSTPPPSPPRSGVRGLAGYWVRLDISVQVVLTGKDWYVMGISWDSHGVIMGLSWDYHGTIGNINEYHRYIMRQ